MLIPLWANLLSALLLTSIEGKALANFRKTWGSSLKVEKPPNTTRVASNYTVPDWKKVLPDPLPKRRTLEKINIPLSTSTSVKVFILGTSHVSNDSSKDVRILLEYSNPEVVFLELCDQRIPMLVTIPEKETSNLNTTFWDRVKSIQELSGMSRGVAIGTVLLTQVQDQYAESLDVELGGEFRVAWEYCGKHRPICVLGDRPLKITLLRSWESLSWWGKTKCIGALIWSSLQKPDPQELREWMQGILEGDSDVLTESMAELRKSFPSLERVILKERDAYLACKIYQTCSHLDLSQNHTMVAIVGAGHGPGICNWLTNGNGQTPEEILRGVVETKKNKNVDSLVRDVTQLPVYLGTE